MTGQVIGSLLLSFGIPTIIFAIMMSRDLFFTGAPALIATIVGISMTAIGIVLLYSSREKLSPKYIDKIDNQYSCPICQSKDFTWGASPQMHFRKSIGVDKPVFSRVCLKCGNLQQFIDRSYLQSPRTAPALPSGRP